METIYLHHPIEVNDLKRNASAIALGFFDGVHIGHQQVIKTTLEKAHTLNLESAVMTFHPHPKEILGTPAEPMRYITPLPDKIKHIKELGIDKLYVVNFTKEFATLTQQQFVDQYLIALGVKHVVAGFDFTYGQFGSGTMETLPQQARGNFSCTLVDKVTRTDEKISSTRVRKMLTAGNVEQIPDDLGRSYEVRGEVIDGDKRGRTIGFPTANIKLTERYVIPRTGVYAVNVELEGELYQGVCNVGYKPTFNKVEEGLPSIEVHILDFNREIYGKLLTVRWLKRIRSEQRFSGIEALVEQINRDKQVAIEFFNNNSKVL